MRLSEIEFWALNIIERVEKGQPIEDARVEAKSKWIDDPADFARRIAAQANAARGESILFVIGVDEKAKRVPGAPTKDKADWWPQVKKHFDGVPPSLLDRHVFHDGVTVTALYFETDQPPYVVKNPAGGKIQFEVPWREGEATRTARREDLMRVLVPATRLPDVEIGCVTLRGNRNSPGFLTAEAYFEPAPGTTAYIAFHRTTGRIRLGDRPWVDLSRIKIRPHAEPDDEFGPEPDRYYFRSLTIRRSETEVEIGGPGFAFIEAQFDLGTWGESGPMQGWNLSEPLSFEVRLAVSRCAVPLIVHQDLPPDAPQPGELGRWGTTRDPVQW